MATYGVKYRCEFTTTGQQDMTLELSLLNYSGSVIDVEGQAEVAVQKYQEDNTRGPIKGCVLEIKLINENNNVTLTDFYSINDNDWYVELKPGTGLGRPVFKGYLVQTDCEEELIDYTHEINLSATDGLGLLKDVPLDQAARLQGPFSDYSKNIAYGGSYTIAMFFFGLNANAGDTIIISNSGVPRDGTYTVQSVADPGIGGYFTIVVDQLLVPWAAAPAADIRVITPIDLTQRMTYAKIIRLCLLSTFLQLETYVFGNIIEVDAIGAQRFLEQTIEAPNNYQNGDKWDDCYTVLSKILLQFNAVLFQSHNDWIIQRWTELRRFLNATPGQHYDDQMDFVDVQNFTGVYTYTPVADDTSLNAMTASIIRPQRFIKHIFNYRQPEDLLVNSQFNTVGNLLNQFVSGSNTVYEYLAPGWFPGFGTPAPDTMEIRVVRDTATGIEIERYAVLRNAASLDDPRQWRSTTIEVEAGDRFKYSFSFRTNVSQPGVVSITFAVENFDGTTTMYVDNNGQWSGAVNYQYQVLSGDNTNQWHNVEIYSDNIAMTGTLAVYLAIATANPADETHYKDLRFEYFSAASGTVNVIGQIHTNTQNIDTNNSTELEIFQDDTRSAVIAGTTFLPQFPVLNQLKTTIWDYQFGSGERARLQELITREKLFTGRIARTRLRGTQYGLAQGVRNIQMNACLLFPELFPGLNFIFGSLTINWADDNFEYTAYEEYEDTEDDSDLNSAYEFEYIYRTK